MAKRRNFSAAFKAKVALEAIKAQNSMAAVSAEGRAHWVSILRLNSSCRRSIALVVRNDFWSCAMTSIGSAGIG